MTVPTFLYGCIFYGDWMWASGILLILLLWFNLMSHMCIIPSLGIYVVMVERVFQSFLRFCVIFFLYLLVFAITLQLILPHADGFTALGHSLSTTWVMMVGEMNYADVSGSDDMQGLGSNQWLMHVIFVIFLIGLSLINMNLLTGIAVSDVHKLMKKSECSVLKMQIAYSLMAESLKTFLQMCFKPKITIIPQMVPSMDPNRQRQMITLLKWEEGNLYPHLL